jgi:hypothetical protein
MARRKYIKGALVEARNSKYGKGFGIIVSDVEKKDTTVHGYYSADGLEYFDVHWFKRPNTIDHWTFVHRAGRFSMSKNQIKVVRKR